ncbi:hypothetical protein BC628DRAFT_398172 [Trametes gibbosa]|nr:hypothetical protein BC628DRAFT_398172 [Trametes gibbosa]
MASEASRTSSKFSFLHRTSDLTGIPVLPHTDGPVRRGRAFEERETGVGRLWVTCTCAFVTVGKKRSQTRMSRLGGSALFPRTTTRPCSGPETNSCCRNGFLQCDSDKNKTDLRSKIQFQQSASSCVNQDKDQGSKCRRLQDEQDRHRNTGPQSSENGPRQSCFGRKALRSRRQAAN